MNTPRTTDRDPQTGAPRAGKSPFPKDGADEGGVKSGEPVAPTPSNQISHEVQNAHDGQTGERATDPSVSIESINGEGAAGPDRAGRAGGMIGEGGS